MAYTTSQLNNAHPIIGIIILGLALPIQPILGTVHHVLFKRQAAQGHNVTGPNLWWGRTHIWLGRAAITLGMINGGLGLQLSGNASRGEIIAYGVIAGMYSNSHLNHPTSLLDLTVAFHRCDLDNVDESSRRCGGEDVRIQEERGKELGGQRGERGEEGE